MTEPENGKCAHSWCAAEQVTVCTTGGGGQAVAHEGPARAIQAADDQLVVRPVALPGYDLPPDEEVLAELEVTVLIKPGLHRTSHVLLTAGECEDVIAAFIAVRADLNGSLTAAAASTGG